MSDHETVDSPDEVGVPVILMRGGTSKGVFLRLTELPTDAAARDALALRLLGSPDPMQIDGLGGTYSSTSKLMAVDTADNARRLGYPVESDAPLAYLFAQVGIDTDVVDWSGNCGNLTSAVVPFAVHAGLLPLPDGRQSVTIHNVNTRRDVVIGLDVAHGKPSIRGDFAVAGVPGTGSRIDVSFLDPAGSLTGRLFPTGNPVDRVEIYGETVDVTILDVSSPVVAVRARAVGLVGDEAPPDLNARPDLLARLERVRAAAAVMCGFAADVAAVARTSPALPRVMLIGPRFGEGDETGFVVRMTSMGKVHHAIPGTGLAAAAVLFSLPGTVAGIEAAPGRDVSLRHPKGTVVVRADVDGADDPRHARVHAVSVPRTARRLLAGIAYVPAPSS